MHILLTDVLACPRCGPEFGLLVLADRLEERRVIEGRLGCANCREAYPVRGGVADLRLRAAGESPSARPSKADDGEEDEDAPTRLAALMGLTGPGGMALLAGPGARHAAAVAALVPDLEVIALRGGPDAAAEPEPGVSRVAAGEGALPFRAASLRAAALTGGADGALLREGLRALRPGSRLLVDPAPAGTAEGLRALGAEVLLEQEDVVVARAPGRPVELRRNALR